MARSDLLIDLIRAGSRGDQTHFRRSAEALIAEERAKNHHVLADRLAEYLNPNGSSRSAPLVEPVGLTEGFVYERRPQRSLNELVLSDDVRTACEELIEEQQRSDLLRSYNLEPRHRILLVGPPGNGKTSLAESVAEALCVPFLVVRYEGIIGSFLGETAVRLSKLFDFVRTRRCVLFFDEFDTVGKERGDTHETGEIKRVVSSLLLQIDALPSYVVVITATNHPELLDRAVWRRFQVYLQLPKPERAQLRDWLANFETATRMTLGCDLDGLASKLYGMNYSDVEEFATSVRRRVVLDSPNVSLKRIISSQIRKTRSGAALACQIEEKG